MPTEVPLSRMPASSASGDEFAASRRFGGTTGPRALAARLGQPSEVVTPAPPYPDHTRSA